MKTQITGILAGATLLAGSAFAEIELSNAGMPKLSLSGWVDSNYINSSVDQGTGVGNPFADADRLALNEVEVNFLFDFGSGLTAQFDIDYTDSSGTDDIDLEQAFFTYSFTEDEDSSFSVSAGRFLSYMGWESADLVNLYQFSYGYASGIGGYQDGVRADYANDMFSVGAALVDSVYANDKDESDIGFELKATFDGVENLTVFAGYSYDEAAVAGTDDAEAFNVWASYQMGDLLVAAEYSTIDDAAGTTDSDSFLVMANYTVNDWLGFTARYSNQENSLSAGGANTSELDEFTIAALLTAHDNLGFIVEFRHDEDDVSGDESDTIAIEATLTF